MVWVLAAFALAACSEASSVESPGVRSSPGQTAVEYVNALAAGDYERAIAFVTPAERYVLEAIAAGDPPTGTAKNIAIGSETVTGNSAVVILTGTLCSAAGGSEGGSTGSGGVASSSPPAETGAESGDAPRGADGRCTTNHDPHSADPMFRVLLKQVPSTDRWFVTFDLGQVQSG